MICKKYGRLVTGKNRPQRNTMGKRTKLEKVWASKNLADRNSNGQSQKGGTDRDEKGGRNDQKPGQAGQVDEERGHDHRNDGVDHAENDGPRKSWPA